jgi:hypothetical protein
VGCLGKLASVPACLNPIRSINANAQEALAHHEIEVTEAGAYHEIEVTQDSVWKKR